ncbi:MAG: hypothetical protein Unbinned3696contig1008_38 [Prokaryotic dsDNA virus sp.]|nr:MAG: hypothetical protein Unbinned3696contig1008_38 [Prokaryotic dsDNA virus sp.]
MSKWEPINTAPKDGTPILVPGSVGTIGGIRVTLPVTVSWRDCPYLGDLPDFKGGWRPMSDGQRALKPTHWMPLPDAPVAA